MVTSTVSSLSQSQFGDLYNDLRFPHIGVNGHQSSYQRGEDDKRLQQLATEIKSNSLVSDSARHNDDLHNDEPLPFLSSAQRAAIKVSNHAYWSHLLSQPKFWGSDSQTTVSDHDMKAATQAGINAGRESVRAAVKALHESSKLGDNSGASNILQSVRTEQQRDWSPRDINLLDSSILLDQISFGDSDIDLSSNKKT